MRPELRNLLIDTRFWLTAAAGTLLALVALGLLIGILANPLVVRTVPTRPADIAVWLASAPLIGLTLATYVVRPHRVDHRDRGRLRMLDRGLRRLNTPGPAIAAGPCLLVALARIEVECVACDPTEAEMVYRAVLTDGTTREIGEASWVPDWADFPEGMPPPDFPSPSN